MCNKKNVLPLSYCSTKNKTIMLSEIARPLFSKLLDANMRMTEAMETNDLKNYLEAESEYKDLEDQIIDDMGITAWRNFINMGRQVFAPSQN